MSLSKRKKQSREAINRLTTINFRVFQWMALQNTGISASMKHKDRQTPFSAGYTLQNVPRETFFGLFQADAELYHAVPRTTMHRNTIIWDLYCFTWNKQGRRHPQSRPQNESHVQRPQIAVYTHKISCNCHKQIRKRKNEAKNADFQGKSQYKRVLHAYDAMKERKMRKIGSKRHKQKAKYGAKSEDQPRAISSCATWSYSSAHLEVGS